MLRIFLSLILAASAAWAQQTMPLGPYGQVPFVLGNVATDTATLVPGQMTGILTGTPTNAATYTSPTATLLCRLFPFVGSSNSVNFHWEWNIRNTSGGANTITVAGGTGVTITGTATIAQNAIKRFMIVLDVCTGTPAAHIISLGSSTF